MCRNYNFSYVFQAVFLYSNVTCLWSGRDLHQIRLERDILNPLLAPFFQQTSISVTKHWCAHTLAYLTCSRYMCVYSLVTEFDQVQVCRGRRQAAYVQVGFAELLQACAAAVAAAAGTGRSHGVGLHTGNPLLGSVWVLDNLI